MVNNVVQALREYNKEVQNLNANPSSHEYDNKMALLEEKFRIRITRIIETATPITTTNS